MEWEVKDSVWDFGELIGSSSSLEVHKNGGGFSVDLKLGGLGDLGFGSFEKLKETRGSTTSSSPSGSGSSKRSRAAINGAQIMLCLVDGCNADLSKFRDYYRRHRVCERHSKTPLVTIGGKEQRFCQQCSRFQGIGEFDEKKRSCRKRLDGHNRRRRKPQPEAFHMSSGSFWSNHQGAKLLCFSGPEACQSPMTASILTWPKIAKHRQDLHAADQQSMFSEPCLYNGGDKRFPFSLVNYPEKKNQTLPEVSACRRLVNSSTSPQIGRGHQKMLCDRLTQCINSKRALSLLSSHPTQAALDVIHYSDQSIGIGLDNDGLVQYSHSQGVDKSSMLVVPQESNETNPHSQLFQVAPDDLLEKRASQVLPFSWK